jgi:hypothetical protein
MTLGNANRITVQLALHTSTAEGAQMAFTWPKSAHCGEQRTKLEKPNVADFTSHTQARLASLENGHQLSLSVPN